MTNKPPANLSRRDALKLLGAAAGASVLANLPSKWRTPQLAAGVLPAHAKTSGPPQACVEYALQIDIKSDPDTLYQKNGNWSTESPLRWLCNKECAWFFVQANDSLKGNLELEVKVWEHSTFPVTVQTGQTYWIYVGETGHYNEGTGDTLLPPEGSVCPQVKIVQKV